MSSTARRIRRQIHSAKGGALDRTISRAELWAEILNLRQKLSLKTLRIQALEEKLRTHLEEAAKVGSQ